jgi:hypothetical protein
MRLAESAVLVRIQLFSACRRPLHRRLVESEKPTASPQRSPETRSLDLEIHRRCFSAVLFDLILDLLPLVERAQSSAALGNLLRDPNWLLGSGFCRSRCWLGYHNRIWNRLRNIDGFRAGLMSPNHARPP